MADHRKLCRCVLQSFKFYGHSFLSLPSLRGIKKMPIVADKNESVQPLTPEVTTSLGKVKGKTLRSRDGREYYAYTAIPYAKPPVGSLRLLPPVPAEPWSGVRDASMAEAPVCFQSSSLSESLKQPNPIGQEDGLFVNIYTPQIDASFPVLFYIHGGGFEVGSAGPAATKKYFMDEDVVFVNVQYRLGALGFLSNGAGDIPGNMGLKDQALALEWVKKEIKNFGGNPDLITALGISAGGASVHYLCTSPRTRGLLKGGISQSGVGGSPWALTRPENAKKLFTQLTKQLNSPNEVLKALQDAPVQQVVVQNRVFGMDDYFRPVVDGEIIPEWPPQQTNFPWLTGIVANEGLIISMLFEHKSVSMNIDEFMKNIRNHIKEKLGVNEDAVEKIYDRFFKDKDPLKGVEEYFSEAFFEYPALREITRHTGPKYFYHFNRRGTVYYHELDLKGVNHGGESIYFFDKPRSIPKNWPTIEDVQISRSLVKMWVNFARDQKPTPNGGCYSYSQTPEWPTFEDSTEALHITNNGLTTQKYSRYEDIMNFWKGIL